MVPAKAFFSAVIGATCFVSSAGVAAPPVHAQGVSFVCDPQLIKGIDADMKAYFDALGIKPEWIDKKEGSKGNSLTYVLRTAGGDTSTIGLKENPVYEIQDETVSRPVNHQKKMEQVATVSKKEIVLALLTPGRLTELSGDHCSVQALKDHVGIRQNIVLWTQNVHFGWPTQGHHHGHAFWNKKYFDYGTPLANHPMEDAFLDVFTHDEKYGIGCYTATKLIMIQGVLDYFARVSPNPKLLGLAKAKLNFGDNDPLVDLEPGKMWSFEDDYDPKVDAKIPGKLLQVQYGVAGKNFVPGDWFYLWNTDKESHAVTGYEGSNSIYLGGNKFDDYYGEHHNSFSYIEKIYEIYGWREHYWSLPEDYQTKILLTPEQIETFGKTPDEGGFLLSFRTSPIFF